jgi:hypothetical protein
MVTVRKLVPALTVLALLVSGCDLAVDSQAAKTDVGAASVATGTEAQSALRNVLVTAKTVFVGSQSYDGATPSGLAAVDPGLCYVSAGASSVASGGACEAGSGRPSVSVYGRGQTFAAAAMAPSGACFWIRDQIGGGTAYGAGSPCTGVAALGASAPAFPAG